MMDDSRCISRTGQVQVAGDWLAEMINYTGVTLFHPFVIYLSFVSPLFLLRVRGRARYMATE